MVGLQMVNELHPHPRAHSHTRQEIFQALQPPLPPIMVKRHRVTHDQQGEQKTDGELGTLTHGAKGDDADWRGQHAKSTTQAGLGKTDEKDRRPDQCHGPKLRHAAGSGIAGRMSSKVKTSVFHGANRARVNKKQQTLS